MADIVNFPLTLGAVLRHKHIAQKVPMSEHEQLYLTAHQAGTAALLRCVPEPMVIGTAIGLSNVLDESKPCYVVADGPCGFAWINIKPGTSAFAKWLVKNGHARKDSYYGGVTVWVRDGNQSMQKKEAYARAFAKVLFDAGIKAFPMSRLD